MGRFRRLIARLDDADVLRRVHGCLLWFWLVMSIPSFLFWKDSVPYLVFVSVYALVVSHWSAWGAARVEQEQKNGG